MEYVCSVHAHFAHAFNCPIIYERALIYKEAMRKQYTHAVTRMYMLFAESQFNYKKSALSRSIHPRPDCILSCTHIGDIRIYALVRTSGLYLNQ